MRCNRHIGHRKHSRDAQAACRVHNRLAGQHAGAVPRHPQRQQHVAALSSLRAVWGPAGCKLSYLWQVPVLCNGCLPRMLLHSPTRLPPSRNTCPAIAYLATACQQLYKPMRCVPPPIPLPRLKLWFTETPPQQAARLLTTQATVRSPCHTCSAALPPQPGSPRARRQTPGGRTRDTPAVPIPAGTWPKLSAASRQNRWACMHLAATGCRGWGRAANRAGCGIQPGHIVGDSARAAQTSTAAVGRTRPVEQRYIPPVLCPSLRLAPHLRVVAHAALCGRPPRDEANDGQVASDLLCHALHAFAKAAALLRRTHRRGPLPPHGVQLAAA